MGKSVVSSVSLLPNLGWPTAGFLSFCCWRFILTTTRTITIMTKTTAAATPPSNGALDDEDDAAAAPFPVVAMVTVCEMVGWGFSGVGCTDIDIATVVLSVGVTVSGRVFETAVNDAVSADLGPGFEVAYVSVLVMVIVMVFSVLVGRVAATIVGGAAEAEINRKEKRVNVKHELITGSHWFAWTRFSSAHFHCSRRMHWPAVVYVHAKSLRQDWLHN